MVERAPPLADVLVCAVVAWERFVAGQALDRGVAFACAHAPALRSAVQDVTYTAVRHRAFSEHAIGVLARQPPAPPLAALLALALGQLMRERHADYTIVDQAVSAARRIASPATGFVNALLRNFLRRRVALLAQCEADPVLRYNAPAWWIERMRAACPATWREVLDAQLEAPPQVLRVAPRRAIDAYRADCAAQGVTTIRVGPQAVQIVKPRPVAELPGFAEGVVSVQDAGAQLAAPWLGAADGERVLDACAAPGGKTTHLAELAALELTALELDAERAERIEDNLRRTQTRARVVIGDAAEPARWWDGQPFDRILLDAPCTASGIVRRHPDIPWLRRPSDVVHLATVQTRLLAALWPLLKPGGRLLYVVCSLFPEEGPEQIARFAGEHPEARVAPLPAGSASVLLEPTPAAAPAWDGASALPTVHDGFFYALLEKT